MTDDGAGTGGTASTAVLANSLAASSSSTVADGDASASEGVADASLMDESSGGGVATGDGESSSTGDATTSGTTAHAPVCGDGVVEGDETCDDMNDVPRRRLQQRLCTRLGGLHLEPALSGGYQRPRGGRPAVPHARGARRSVALRHVPGLAQHRRIVCGRPSLALPRPLRARQRPRRRRGLGRADIRHPHPPDHRRRIVADPGLLCLDWNPRNRPARVRVGLL
ncbi:MAG: DUF4215 domain-containing protein [Myxococcales bacterium]|nr:DUF4215 domain-containing protein [Myxococcales bacterium]